MSHPNKPLYNNSIGGSIRGRVVDRLAGRAGRSRRPLKSSRRSLRYEALEARQLLTGDFSRDIVFGDVELDRVFQVAADSSGDVYASGSFRGTVDIAPDESFADNRDILSVPIDQNGFYVAKYDVGGNLLWSYHAEGQATATGHAISSAMEVEAGGVYLAGQLFSAWDFNLAATGPEGFVNQADGERAQFLLRLDATSGEFDWVIVGGGLSHSRDSGVTVDSAGNAYFSFRNSLPKQFDGDGFFYDGSFIEYPRSWMYLVAKLSPDGVTQDIQTISSDWGFNLELAIDDSSIDPADWRLVGAGDHDGALFFDDGSTLDNPSEPDNLSADPFVFSTDAHGALQWSQQYDTEYSIRVAGLTVDDDGNIYLRGKHPDAADQPLIFDSTDPNAILSQDQDVEYIAKFNAAGDFVKVAPIALDALADGDDDFAWQEMVATDGGLLLSGYARETAEILGAQLVAGSTNVAFVVEVDAGLTNAIMMKEFPGNSRGRSARKIGDIYVAGGSFKDTITLATGEMYSSVGNDDAYLSFFGTSAPSITLDNNTVAENTSTAGGLTIGNLGTNDPDSSESHTYTFASSIGTNDNALFTITGDGLALKEGVALDHETRPAYYIRVQSTNSVGVEFEQEFEIIVQDLAEIVAIRIGNNNSRSTLRRIEIEFDTEVNLTGNALEVLRRGPQGGLVDIDVATEIVDGKTIASVGFSGEYTGYGSLNDGNYQLNIVGTQITDAYGNAIDGNQDGISGGNRSFGDDTGDRVVDLVDFSLFRRAYGSHASSEQFVDEFDYDGNGVIGISDFARLRSRFGTQLEF